MNIGFYKNKKNLALQRKNGYGCDIFAPVEGLTDTMLVGA